MPEPHIIRLRGRWEYAVETPSGTARGSFDASGDWLASLPGLASVRFSRRFHAPTGLAPETRVELLLQGFPSGVGLALNGAPLEDATDIAPRLQSTNLLELTLPNPPPATLIAEVALAIHETP